MKHRASRKSLKKGAFSLTEALMVFLIFALVAATVWEIFISGSRNTSRLSKTVELASQARICDTKIQRELRCSVKIISPQVRAPSEAKSSPVLIFLNQLNELIVLYVNDDGELRRQNRTKACTESILAKNVSAFRVFRKGRRLVNYHLELSMKDHQHSSGTRRFSLLSSVTLRNNYN